MSTGKITVMVNASFEKGEALFAWLKPYAQQYDNKFLYWDEFAFSIDPVPETDAILIFNNPSEKIETICFPEKVIAFMMEPGIYTEQPWMFKGLQQYAAVYSPIQSSSNTIASPGFLGWHVLQNWAELFGLALPEKKMDISCIASTLAQFKGHRQRLHFIRLLEKEMPSINMFGKGRRYIPDKMDGLRDYRYSIAIENSSIPYYFTEKITDCFLAYTVPFYHGCKNIGAYFPEKSFIRINIENPAEAIKTIRQTLEIDDWGDRLNALKEARELVLNKYQPLAGAASILRQAQPSVKQRISLKPVPDTLVRKVKNLLNTIRSKK